MLSSGSLGSYAAHFLGGLDDSDDWLELVVSTGKGRWAHFCSAKTSFERYARACKNQDVWKSPSHLGSSVERFGEGLIGRFLGMSKAYAHQNTDKVVIV